MSDIPRSRRQGADRAGRRRSDLVSRVIRQHSEEAQLLNEGAAALGASLKADRVSIIMKQAESDLRGVARWHREGLVNLGIEMDNPPKGIATFLAESLNRREPYALDSVATLAGIEAASTEYAAKLGIDSIIVAPIRDASKAIGVLAIFHGMPRKWTDDEIRLVEVAAEEFGLAVQRARLLQGQEALVEQLRDLDRTRSELFSTVSHELRTPLTSIAGFVELLMDGEAGPLTDSQAEMLATVERNTRRLQLLIDDLITLSRIEAGAHRQERVAVDMAAVIESAARSLNPAILEKSIRLRVQLPSSRPLVVGDLGQLDRVLLNLMSNAVKFTPVGGTVDVALTKSGDEVAVTVSDSGIGIPENEIPQLFGRFFRASNAKEQGVPGTGLGLAIVHGIVDQHGGTMSVESVEGEGSVFRINLPVATEVRDRRQG